VLELLAPLLRAEVFEMVVDMSALLLETDAAKLLEELEMLEA